MPYIVKLVNIDCFNDPTAAFLYNYERDSPDRSFEALCNAIKALNILDVVTSGVPRPSLVFYTGSF